MKPTKPHNSMRGYFAYNLYEAMEKDKDIIVIVGDLGYGMFDAIRDDFPGQFYNVGAAEQLMVNMACGMALEGKKVFCYSITPFLLARPFETLRNYVIREHIPIALVGSGRDNDYSHDGFSHWCGDDLNIIRALTHVDEVTPIATFWEDNKEDMEGVINETLEYMEKSIPVYINLKR